MKSRIRRRSRENYPGQHGSFWIRRSGAGVAALDSRRDLVLPGSDHGRSALPGTIMGAEYDSSWVVFEMMQVVQLRRKKFTRIGSSIYFRKMPATRAAVGLGL